MKTLTSFYDPLMTHTQHVRPMWCGELTGKQRHTEGKRRAHQQINMQWFMSGCDFQGLPAQHYSCLRHAAAKGAQTLTIYLLSFIYPTKTKVFDLWKAHYVFGQHSKDLFSLCQAVYSTCTLLLVSHLTFTSRNTTRKCLKKNLCRLH